MSCDVDPGYPFRMAALAIGVQLPFLLDNQRELFKGQLKEVLANVIVLMYAILFVYVMLVRVGQVSRSNLVWTSANWKRNLGLGRLGHLATQMLFLSYMLSQGLTFLGDVTVLSNFSFERRLEGFLLKHRQPCVRKAFLEGVCNRAFKPERRLGRRL